MLASAALYSANGALGLHNLGFGKSSPNASGAVCSGFCIQCFERRWRRAWVQVKEASAAVGSADDWNYLGPLPCGETFRQVGRRAGLLGTSR
jgi:hypothetical protein